MTAPSLPASVFRKIGGAEGNTPSTDAIFLKTEGELGGSPRVVLLTPQNRAGFWRSVALLPRNICIGILAIYRAVISPLYGDVCKYYPSCSRYALEAIQQHGMLKGVWLGARRLARCHPWAEGGIDDVPACEHGHPAVVRFGFVAGIEPAPHRDREGLPA